MSNNDFALIKRYLDILKMEGIEQEIRILSVDKVKEMLLVDNRNAPQVDFDWLMNLLKFLNK